MIWFPSENPTEQNYQQQKALGEHLLLTIILSAELFRIVFSKVRIAMLIEELGDFW